MMTKQSKLKGTLGAFTEADFTATKFVTAKEKAKIANNLTRFILSGFKQCSFSQAIYTHLSNMFGHIAHYNINGFYETWFSSPQERCKWAEYVLRGGMYGCVGSPAHTRSDVEKALMAWMRDNHIAEQLEAIYRAEVEARELTLLRSLQAKYPQEAREATAIPVQIEPVARPAEALSRQLSLF
jgi:hypothetical protein